MVSTTLVNEIYRPFIRKGNVKDGEGNNIPVTILTQSLILERKLPRGKPLGFATIKGIGGKALKVPLRKVKLTTGKISREIIVGVVKTLPMKKIDLLLENEVKIEFAQEGKNCESKEKGQKANPYNLRSKKQDETGENIPMVNKTCEELKRAPKNYESLKKLYKQVDKTMDSKHGHRYYIENGILKRSYQSTKQKGEGREREVQSNSHAGRLSKGSPAIST